MNIIGTLLPVYIGWSRLGMVDTYYPLIVPAFLGGGTRTRERMLLVRVSCVCGRTSSFPAGERNQRLPGAGEVSMRRAGPRTPLMQAACVGGASQGRPKRYPSGSARTAPLKTFRFQRVPVLRGGKARRVKDALCAWNLLRGGTTTPKASPERGGAREASGGVRLSPQGRGGSVSRRDHNQA